MSFYDHKSLARLIFRSHRLAGVVAVGVAVVAIVAPVGAAEEGGATIASAPTLTWGVPQDGIGGDYWGDPTDTTSTDPDHGFTLWRVPVFAGDELTVAIVFSGDTCPFIGSLSDRVAFVGPSVTDATLLNAHSLNPAAVKDDGCGSEPLHSRLIWRLVPFTGLATLQIGVKHSTTFSFVATIRHRTLIQLAAVPRTLASPAGTVLLQARITSAAGAPTGLCAFDRRKDARGRWLQVGRAELNSGACAARITAAAKHSAAFRVRYLPDSTWQPSEAVTRSVLIS